MTISSYIMNIVAVGAAASLAVGLVPGEPGNRGVRRSVISAVSLTLTLCILIPLIPALGSLRTRAENGDFGVELPEEKSGGLSRLTESIGAEAAEQIGDELTRRLARHFALPESSVTVEVEVLVTEEAVTIRRIVLILSGRAILCDPRELAEFVREQTDCDRIEVIC